MHERNVAHRYVWTLIDGNRFLRPSQGLHGEQRHVRPFWNVPPGIPPNAKRTYAIQSDAATPSLFYGPISFVTTLLLAGGAG